VDFDNGEKTGFLVSYRGFYLPQNPYLILVDCNLDRTQLVAKNLPNSIQGGFRFDHEREFIFG
jgi:hypothetical protein